MKFLRMLCFRKGKPGLGMGIKNINFMQLYFLKTILRIKNEKTKKTLITRSPGKPF
ncbi:hypothetical protein X474_23465 [Dethiosulfatarculus sandiegensis]|uniref:Uncharacterized protein n=1 Tax=Dethiosulfatarculus sandiegensis TaxID=1429043 RepID=A0A0D2HLP3_9BACT|nr:hypothetical protein X474_23465 [Dethiosulfatarculus sandiegensis]